ncbi:hypothetical protein BU17DRAFT_67828 [Hysterangium stoloniferum]|nr:hypothetical protein BU17DRAFT_67828 [Hysterangium stoloniferum]
MFTLHYHRIQSLENKIITSTTTMKPLGFTKPIVVRSRITLTAVMHLSMFLCYTNVDTASQRILSVILHHCVSDTQFKVDILTDISIFLGYQLPHFNQGFSPFAAAVTGFKLLANIELNLEQLQDCSVCFQLHPFPKGSLVAVLMSKPFKGGTSRVAHLPHALRIHIEETICRGLKQRHAEVIGDACIAWI